MKKIFGIAVLAAFMGIASPSNAQDTSEKKEGIVKKAGNSIKKGSKKAWKGTKKGVKAVGNETAELATKGKGEITDKTSEEWVGPAGQKIYVDDGNKYYWVSEKGKKIFVTEKQMKAKQQ
ncbi:MAG TPA: hypothetical protein VM884_07975 [Flavisolibacter sp.]|nr:hypothetical protein [Flavisolibacter sp.]